MFSAILYVIYRNRLKNRGDALLYAGVIGLLLSLVVLAPFWFVEYMAYRGLITLPAATFGALEAFVVNWVLVFNAGMSLTMIAVGLATHMHSETYAAPPKAKAKVIKVEVPLARRCRS